MALPTMVPVRVRVSWDTQQRLPYNRNAPRKIKRTADALSLPTTSQNQSSSTLSLATTTTTLKEIDVHQLLYVNRSSPRKGRTVDLEDSTYLGYERWLPRPPMVEKPRSVYNAATLAYIGDCIFELYARRHFLSPALNIEEYNDRVMAVVRCEAQDALLQKLLNDNFLSGEERDVLRWGKNIISAKTKTKKRAGLEVYNSASSLETLVGYLYLTDVKRLEDIMSRLGFSVGASGQPILKDLNGELPKDDARGEVSHTDEDALGVIQ
ncbi:hypothetical protein Nepgr_005591 [Nepenthes gracilis]|uniref:RNase III domain-containing protein n=1 Tax=Nepenthes gracilis TaxID=150966 RepID=A0AAD3S3X4_NEPGR|nr:hypothetical protein Nepgr_005591 [Nepenthes gracilis]